jgi:hypothetical protein
MIYRSENKCQNTHDNVRSAYDRRRSSYDRSAAVAPEEWRTACGASPRYSLRMAQPLAIGDRR